MHPACRRRRSTEFDELLCRRRRCTRRVEKSLARILRGASRHRRACPKARPLAGPNLWSRPSADEGVREMPTLWSSTSTSCLSSRSRFDRLFCRSTLQLPSLLRRRRPSLPASLPVSTALYSRLPLLLRLLVLFPFLFVFLRVRCCSFFFSFFRLLARFVALDLFRFDLSVFRLSRVPFSCRRSLRLSLLSVVGTNLQALHQRIYDAFHGIVDRGSTRLPPTFDL